MLLCIACYLTLPILHTALSAQACGGTTPVVSLTKSPGFLPVAPHCLCRVLLKHSAYCIFLKAVHSLLENKKFGHHPQAMGYACAIFSIFSVYAFCGSVWRRMCTFSQFFWVFLQIFLQLKDFFQKFKCEHHRKFAKFDVLRLSRTFRHP